MRKMGRPSRNIILALEIRQIRYRLTERVVAEVYGWPLSRGQYDPSWKEGCSTVRRYVNEARKFDKQVARVLVEAFRLILWGLFCPKKGDFLVRARELNAELPEIVKRLKRDSKKLKQEPPRTV